MGVKAAIDLLWVRPKQVGGIESYIRNILDGLRETSKDFELWLLVSRDNADTFACYVKDRRFHINICNIQSVNISKRIIWQNLYLGRELKKLNLDVCFEPYYCKPILGVSKINFITTIHDLQALHYPEYFSKGKVAWMRFSWRIAIHTSKLVIATSEYVRNDILKNYNPNIKKVVVLNIPITIEEDEVEDLDFIKQKYKIEEKGYFFSVSSLLPHKNVGVLLDIIKLIKIEKIDLPCKLIVSGVGGKSRAELERKICELQLEDHVILTKFIENPERNALYKYSRAFLFPSIFEGFGMPPVEAMFFYVPVITTNKTSIPEVTQEKAVYVTNPSDPKEWIHKIQTAKADYQTFDFKRYDKRRLALKLLNIMERIKN